MMRAGRPVEADARLRQKNQLTLPGAIVRVLGAAPGDVIVFVADPAKPGRAHLHVLPRSFAGSLKGVYGTGEEMMEYLRGERASWDGEGRASLASWLEAIAGVIGCCAPASIVPVPRHDQSRHARHGASVEPTLWQPRADGPNASARGEIVASG